MGAQARESRLGPRRAVAAMLAVPTRQVFRAYGLGKARVDAPPGFCPRCRTPHALVDTVAAPVAGGPGAGDDLCKLRWVPIGGPLPALAYKGDAHLLERLAQGAVPLLPVDIRYAVPR
jgi:hypothetical protein